MKCSQTHIDVLLCVLDRHLSSLKTRGGGGDGIVLSSTTDVVA